MSNDAPYLKAHKNGVLLYLHVQPRASKTELVGLHGDALKIRIQAPPVDSAANEAILRFLADKLSLPLSRLSIVAGETARKKTVLLSNCNAEAIQAALQA